MLHAFPLASNGCRAEGSLRVGCEAVGVSKTKTLLAAELALSVGIMCPLFILPTGSSTH